MDWLTLLDNIDAPKKLNEVKQLNHLPIVQQQTNTSCGIACLRSILYYYGISVEYKDLVKKAHTDEDGTQFQDLIRVMKDYGLEVELHKGMLLSDLLKFVDEGTPVIIAIQAWVTKPTKWDEEWDNGHWVVVVGYDDSNVYFMDPVLLANYGYIPREELGPRWHDKDRDTMLRQAGISVKGKPAYNHKSITRVR